jgi:hypothetical protein
MDRLPGVELVETFGPTRGLDQLILKSQCFLRKTVGPEN